MRHGASILLAFESLCEDGGIASVSRTIARVFDEEAVAGRVRRVDRVILHDRPESPPPPPEVGSQYCESGSKARFLWHLGRAGIAHRPDICVFDHLGVARSAVWPLPGFPRDWAVVVHGIELDAVRPGNFFHRALLRAPRVLTNSHFTAAQLTELVPQVAERVRTLRLCIDPDRIALWQRDEPAGWNVKGEAAALIVGRMAAVEGGKGHDLLLRAWPDVCRRVPEAQLWIAGGGDDRPRLEAMAREIGCGPAVQFLGRIDDAELSDRYRRARIVAMPSRQEGFGLIYAEAMWHGLACLGSSADAAREVIADGETGRLVAFGDVPALVEALVALLGDAALAQRMGEAGRRRVDEHFSYGNFRRDLLAGLGLL